MSTDNTLGKNILAYRTDIIVLCILVVIASIFAVITSDTVLGKSLVAGAVFMLPPVAYLGYRKPKPWNKILISALIFGFALGLFFEFIQEYSQAYSVVSRIFPKLFGVVPFDNILGHFMMALLTFTFYEHFVAQKYNAKISHRIKYAIGLVISMIALVLGIYFMQPSWLIVAYPYVVFGTIAILPIVIYIYRHPKSVRDFSFMVPYFFFLYFIVEIFAVRYTWWIYPGDSYIGWVNIKDISYPFEELFFWMLFYAAALISYYKIFIDRSE